MTNEKSQNRWLWYPGDFEIRHGLLQNFQREERGFDWPAYWYMDDCHRNVKFKRYYFLDHPSMFKVTIQGVGYVEINGQKHPCGKWLTCPAGKVKIRIFVGHTSGLPAMFIEGDEIKSDIGWTASNFIEEYPAGWSPLYVDIAKDPNQIYYQKECVHPVTETEVNGGVLFDFGRAVNGCVELISLDDPIESITLCYGESDVEAMDIEYCYYKQIGMTRKMKARKRAFRYLFIPEVSTGMVQLQVFHEFLSLSKQATFSSDSSLLNQIWSVSEETFKLCSDLFFIDGIKRDRWIWSGDAYQSFMINQYLFFDEEINKRTIFALRGQNEIKQHMNTIVDYSILWLIGIETHYMMTKDCEFLRIVYPKMQSLIGYLMEQTNELGFIYGREKDWIFIDWSEMDKEGTLAAEQVLLLKAYHSMITCGNILAETYGETEIYPTDLYQEKYQVLKQSLFDYFWDEELGAFIDCYESGRRNVTRHANIFAVLFDFANKEQQQSILKNVLLNDSIIQITTPYFKFYEQDALCKLGQTEINKCIKQKTACDISENIRSSSDIVQAVFILKLA
ncbi:MULTISPECIES: alpha-rhamnosidase [Enterococcus]|uniref:alpha-L-rhamnosidase-related protein n=1 Tax=Enterococcus TaxID=1350 RepID=UPI00215732B7|nr:MULTISPECIES: alpha-rhamnosidase [Enterococcus]